MSLRKGIIAGGNWIIDHVKMIDAFPPQDALANIVEQSSSNGGSPYNILKDLSMLQAPFPLEAIGLVGNDANGKTIVDDCALHGIATPLLKQTNKGATSYTDVMTVVSTGRRTFFHQRGTNALLNAEHFDLSASQASIFHLGYLLLLDKLDTIDAAGRTGASYVFEKALKLGFKTSADIVSETSDRFRSVVMPSLPYIDYLFVNEYEAEKITGLHLTKEGEIECAAAIEACKALLKAGVRTWVVLHFPKGAIAVHADGEIFVQGSVQLPSDRVQGAAGAGDAFAAGVLFGLHEHFPMQKALQLGVCAAASSLFHPTCSLGVQPLVETFDLGNQFGYRSLSFK